jgi:hypothetical protein
MGRGAIPDFVLVRAHVVSVDAAREIFGRVPSRQLEIRGLILRRIIS